MRHTSVAAAVLLSFAAVSSRERLEPSQVGVGQSRTLSFEDRVAAQRAIEEVYWRHRIWPKENARPKPPLADVMTEEALRFRVEDYLKKSNALAQVWGRPITSDQLQAEMERMGRGTKAPQILGELFAALGDDPGLIAETLVREKLVERLMQDAWAYDERFHGQVKRDAQTAIARAKSLAELRSLGGRYRETTWRLRSASGSLEEACDGPRTTVSLDAGEWEEHLRNLARKLDPVRLDGPAVQGAKSKGWSRLEETAESFVVTSILSTGAGEVTTATVAWPKASLVSWWTLEREKHGTALVEPVGTYASVRPRASASCVDDTWRGTFDAGLPDPRFRHTAVWTGTEMIVWGGYNGIGLNDPKGDMNTGGRYDPATDTWMATSTGAGAPSPRHNHTAVWTGTEMIIWGGIFNNFSATSYLNTGGRYDPSADTWVATATGAGVPSARSAPTVVWTGKEMIVWGGYDGSNLNTGGRYDPSTDTWLATSTGAGVPSGRWGHTAVWTGMKMIVWGGYDAGGQANTGSRYDPSTDTWAGTSIGADVPSPRYEHTAVWTGAEMIIWGGGYFDPSGDVSFDTGGRYDPLTDTWVATSTGAGVPSARHIHTAVWTGTEMIVWGGYNYGSLDTGGRYDPSADAWVPTSTGAGVPAARFGHTAVWTGTEMIAWGGYGEEFVSTGGRYDPSTDAWAATSTGAGVPSARFGHTAVWTGTEMIIWGGNEDDDYLNSGGRYDPSTDTWVATSTGAGTPSARSSHTAVWTGTEMILWGGYDGFSEQNTGGRYDPSTDTWVATSTPAGVPSARFDHTAVWTGTEMIVWGGYPYGGLGTGGRYDPSTDAWVATSTGAGAPSARRSHRAVWTGTEMIVWGGFVGTGYSSTGGRYHPATDTWVATSTGAGAPSARRWHTAVWTGTRMIVWGGFGSSGYSNTGARYDPATDTWTATSTGAGAPSARHLHTAVWTGAEMILWGGEGTSGRSNTGGRYDPSTDTWATTSTGAGVPSARFVHTAVWTGSEMILWGGYLPVTHTGGLYCAVSNCAVQTWWRDGDGDGYGNTADSVLSCIQPEGYAPLPGDCDDATPSVHPDAAEVCNGMDDNCEGQVDEDAQGVDPDHDGIRSACDDCPLGYNPEQRDLDHDGQGDICDENDGQILILYGDGPDYIEWQQEAGFTSWNVYEGDLDVLKGTGVYTQQPGSNPLAERHCGVNDTFVEDLENPPARKVAFALVTGTLGGVEGSLGTDSRSVERPNTNPCP